MKHSLATGRALLALSVAVVTGAGVRASSTATAPPVSGEAGPAAVARAEPVVPYVAPVAPAPAALDVRIAPEAFGVSGAVRTHFALPGEPVHLPLAWANVPPADARYRWRPVLGTVAAPGSEEPVRGDSFRAPAGAGVYELEISAAGAVRAFDEVRLVVLVPFGEKKDGRLRGYHVGRYPTEGSERRDRYSPPAGFVEVTRANQDLLLSDHFRLREFLTHDQQDVWPKYAVVDSLLLHKLELVLAELNDRGIRAERMVVMSGFRTPQYNGQGLDRGRANLSRHQYGDAADVWVDNDGDWYMDDLNRDGRRDTRDARVMLEAADRVESRHPHLLGGAGVYPDNGVHGPFIHIDTRGRRARW